MRSGVAASTFVFGLGMFYSKAKKWKWISVMTISCLFHISMFIPLMFFTLTRYFQRTKLIFVFWVASIAMAVLNINIIARLVAVIDFMSARAGGYVEVTDEENSWVNFFIFGFFPVMFGLYNIVILKYKDYYYRWFVNAYMLTHIPYIVLISTKFASRLGYMAEFMMPILLMYPLLVNLVLKIKYSRLKLTILIFVIFLVKAYKVLII